MLEFDPIEETSKIIAKRQMLDERSSFEILCYLKNDHVPKPVESEKGESSGSEQDSDDNSGSSS
jgi:hypothetical protein